MTDDPRSCALVLLVEDEPIQRIALADMIEEGGFSVVEAWDAASAVDILESRADVRLVVTDIEMPGSMDGLTLAAAVRHRWPPIEIVIVSAGQPPDPASLPARAEFVPKPIKSDGLLAILHRMAAAA